MQATLQEQCPEDIKNFSQVIFFPHAQELSQLLKALPSLQKSIKYICSFAEPEIDKIECVATALLGAIAASTHENISVREILEKARSVSPNYIRSLSHNLTIDSEVARVLNSINNFTYNTDKGFLHWNYGDGIFTGTVSYSIDSEQFGKIQRLLKTICPQTFVELHDFLQ